ncbi:MAG TPA: M56 family metallopeptidase [Vicinamibacterales bacterium]
MLFLDPVHDPSVWLPFADAAIKSAFILAIAAGIAFALRQSSAASRHLVWTCALTAALIVPIASLTAPRWTVPLLTVAPAAAVPAPTEVADDEASRRRWEQMQARLQSAGERSADPREGDGPAAARISTTTLIASVWALGALILFGRLLLGLAAVWWMSRRTPITTDAPWMPVARKIAADFGLSRVAFRRSRHATMPMAWGVVRPSVVMPFVADDWPEDRVRIVLLHELAHVRRADPLTHLLAQAACAIHWMNPLAWLAARRLRIERERACDDLVLAYGTSGPDYADQLLTIARTMRTGRLSAATAGASLAMARRSQLEGRLMSILDPTVPRTGVSRTRVALATAVAAAAILPLASMQTWAYESPAMIPPRPAVKPASQAAPSVPEPRSAMKQRIEGSVERTVERTVEGTVKGSVEGAIEGVRGGLNGVDWPQMFAHALGGALGQNPNPNPNPNPSPRQEPDTKQRSKADPKVVAALTEALKDSDKEVRESAMQALVHLRDPGVFDPLVVALKDASPDVRESAAFGLGQLRDKRAVAPLTAALKDADASVREQVVFALGQLRDPSSVDGLVAALRDESPSVREQAAFALGELRDERAVQPLMSMLKDASADVREQSVFALGQLKARSAVDPLIAALKDHSTDVREQAAFALGQIGDPRAVDALSAALKDASADVRQQAAFALGQLAR